MNLDSRICDNIQPGIKVKIALTKNQIEEDWIEDTVKEILTEDTFNENGVEVETDLGYIGFVREIITKFEIISPKEVKKLIEKHETKYFEMKSSFRYDINASEKSGMPIKNDALVRKIVDEIASFMNTEGGILCIGVDNDKQVLGLENDYSLFKTDKEKSDELRNQIKQALIDYLQDDVIHGLFQMEIISLENKEVCIIQVKNSPEPIFVKLKTSCRIDKKDKEEIIWKCYVRSDNGIRSVDFKAFMQIWNMKKSNYESTTL
ncbi:MAG: putative DNA binding domain-containing protein [Thaumarchaeota archaeon]|nr:putative DNA binding domain-containing protein [Nitrososphaerota archaeon]